MSESNRSIVSFRLVDVIFNVVLHTNVTIKINTIEIICKKCHPIISFVALLFPASDIFLLFRMRKAKYVF